MKITLTSPAEGKEPGEVVDVAKARAQWLVQNGYATLDDGNDEEFGRFATSTEAKDDPTLAENREAPGQEPPKPQEKTQAPKSTPKKKDEEPPTDEG